MTHPPNVACDGTIARSDSIGDLAERLAVVYGKLRNLQEDGVNSYQNYSFISLGGVTDPVRAAMAAAGVVVLPSVESCREEPWAMRNGTGVKVLVTMRFTWIAAQSGEWLVTQWTGMALDAGDKGFNRAYSAILKQALLKTFLLSSADAGREDPDADSPEQKAAQPTWTRAELEADIDTLLAQVGDDEAVARFRRFVAGVYAVNNWREIPTGRLAQVRDRLRALDVEARRRMVLEKTAVATAA